MTQMYQNFQFDRWYRTYLLLQTYHLSQRYQTSLTYL
jgi:hypothetical protein